MFLLAGAAEYCPPEAFSQPKYHAVPTNVWALGVTLYLMVNRRLPFYNIRETLEASPKFWKPTLSIGEETETDKHVNVSIYLQSSEDMFIHVSSKLLQHAVI